LPNNLIICFVICVMFIDFTNTDFEIGRNMNKLKLKLKNDYSVN